MDGARFGLALGFVMALGCSSSSFDVGNGPAADGEVDTGFVSTGDTGGGTDTSDPGTDSGGTVTTDTAVADSNVPLDTSVGDSLVGETVSACASPGELAEVWVDVKSTMMAPVGTSTCPFKRITDALTYVYGLGPKPRVIRVRAGRYDEPGLVQLKAGISLLGAGSGMTTIAGGGSCMGVGTCIVRVEGGATLDGVTVDGGPTAKHGIVTGGLDGGNPILRNLKSTNAIGDGNAGILVTSGAVIGPNVDSSGNKIGLVVWGGGATKVTGGNNHFDKNTLYGINHESGGQFTFDGGGTVTGNGSDGIRFGELTTASPPQQYVSFATIRENGDAGIRAMAHAALKLRNNIIQNNKVGVVAIYGLANSFDFGDSDSGKNHFGNSTTRNTMAGVCTLVTRTAPLPLVGNTWPGCPAGLKSLLDIAATATCADISTYADVWWRGTTGPNTSVCTPG